MKIFKRIHELENATLVQYYNVFHVFTLFCRSAPIPVMVWITGGAFQVGSGQWYPGRFSADFLESMLCILRHL